MEIKTCEEYVLAKLADLEQEHSNTLARLQQLEAVNASLSRSISALQEVFVITTDESGQQQIEIKEGALDPTPTSQYRLSVLYSLFLPKEEKENQETK